MAGVADIFQQPGNIIIVCRPGEHIGSEVAEAAFGPAEGHGNVEAKGHAAIILWEAPQPVAHESHLTCQAQMV